MITIIVNEDIAVRWNPNNRKHYEEKGYKFSSYNDTFVVSLADIHPKSTVDVDVECDDCGYRMVRKYYSVFALREKNNRPTDLCRKCAAKRKNIDIKQKQMSNELTIGSPGYWIFYENRKQQLLNYLKKHGHLNNMNQFDNNLYGAINKYDGGLKNICDKLGIDWYSVKKRKPRGFYSDFGNVKEKIELFIVENNRFPTQKELVRKYSIQESNIQLHGGMNEIKRKMNYSTKDDLLDSHGYYNKSLLEYQTAEFLIKNKISYKRETMPFSDRQIKCDFEIQNAKGHVTYVEVWGYSKNDNGVIARRYNAKRKEKSELYISNEMNLIELECDIMNGLSLDKLNDYFKCKFKDIINIETTPLDVQYLVHPNSISNKKIAEILLSVSTTPGILPTYSIARESSADKFIREAVRRYGTYQKFADEMGLKFAINKHGWNDITVNDFMFSLVQKGLPITRKNIENHKAGGLFIYIRKTERNSLADRKLDFYEKFIGDIDILPSYDLSFLEKIADSKDRRRINKINPEDSERAKTILNKYHSKIKRNAV